MQVLFRGLGFSQKNLTLLPISISMLHSWLLDEKKSVLMSDVTMQWFREQVKALPSVRACHPVHDRNGDLIIRTWVGMSVRVYFLTAAPTTRHIKRTLQDNTRTYQGSMFVVRQDLLPPDKKRFVPDTWMYALQEINNERIYTFRPDEKAIKQVHLSYVADGSECESWHGDAIPFEKLRVLNVSARTRAIKGQWMVADFGTNPYWHTSDKRAERLRARFRYNNGFQTGQFVWGQYDMGGTPGGPTNDALHKAHMNELERSYQVLGVDLNAEKDEVKAAFRKLAREFHPDVSELEDKEKAANRFHEINAAYEYIKSKRRW